MVVSGQIHSLFPMDINPFHILYLDTPISSMESLRQWLATLLGPSVTAVGFLFIYQQLKLSAKQARLSAKQAKIAADNYDLSAKAAERSAALAAEQQRWKKAEFLAEQVREFHNDEVVARVIYMLDWYRRFFEIPSENDSASKIRVAVLEPIRKEVESVESVVIPCVAPESGRGASCGSRNIERRRTVVA